MEKKKIWKRTPEKVGIKLDLGCGGAKQNGFVGLDIRALPGVDIVHDVECPPYPIEDGACSFILLSHLMEHICPKRVITVMNELWRISEVGGQLLIAQPYAGSRGFWQDPTHTHAWNETTAVYFDPYPFMFVTPKGYVRSNLYDIYKPGPWRILKNDWFANGNTEILFEKRGDDNVPKA